MFLFFDAPNISQRIINDLITEHAFRKKFFYVRLTPLLRGKVECYVERPWAKERRHMLKSQLSHTLTSCMALGESFILCNAISSSYIKPKSKNYEEA